MPSVIAGFAAFVVGIAGCSVDPAAAVDASALPDVPLQAPPEVRGTWVTTTANTAIATPADSEATMRRLAQIGLNTVYVEVWKNGYTQFPSRVLQRTIGVDRRPGLMPADPSDSEEQRRRPARDLLGEALIEAHRNGLVYIAWFEYGFMAAHKTTDNHLRRMKKEWLSLDKDGNEVAPNGFVWLNPLHPEARQFLIDLVLEAVDSYDLDGIQIDDRIVWPYINMGYDTYTKGVYAAEHDGREPPADVKDPEWVRWRADKVNEFSKRFVTELHARRPGLLISLSPAVYPWCYENYCLEWPKWAAWTGDSAAKAAAPRWDEFIPQCYRMNYSAFETTWLDQVKWMKELGGGRIADMHAGIRVVGDGPDSTWDDLRRAIELVRTTGGGGHVLWFSRGVLDLLPKELTGFYDVAKYGPAPNPAFGPGWRRPSISLAKTKDRDGKPDGWTIPAGVAAGAYRVIAHDGVAWRYGQDVVVQASGEKTTAEQKITISGEAKRVELLVDRRGENRAPSRGAGPAAK